MKNLSPGLKHDIHLGLCCLPAIVLIFAVGYGFDQMQAASIMASGAVTLAFGANKTWEGSSLLLLLLTAAGVSLSSFLGCLAGDVPLLQWAIAFLISGYFSGSVGHAALRAALVGAGALLQILCITLLFSQLRFQLQDFTRLAGWAFYRQAMRKYRQKIHLQSSVFFAMLTMCLALLLVEVYQVKNGYWAGMTLLLCLRSHFRESLLRVPARIAGTLSGSVLAPFLLAHLDTPRLLALGFIVSGYLAFTYSYTLITKSYFVFTFFVTVMVIFMLSLFGVPQENVAAERLYATVLGAGFALVAILLTRLFTDVQVMKKLRSHVPRFPRPTPKKGAAPE
ncbi:MAG: FUSC family protein [Yersiniaceae bacterium]|nr:FUSC family protein [Yersiniaceae bacterium]